MSELTQSSQGKPQLHYSAVDTMAQCGEAFRRRYIMNDRTPSGVYLVVGKAVDRSVTKNLDNKIKYKQLLPVEHAVDIARDSVVWQWDRTELELSPDELKVGMAATRDRAIDKAVRLSLAHAKKHAKKLKPTHVQRKWTLELKGFPVDLVGTLDIQEGSDTIRDLKTSGKSPKSTIADQSEQLTAYALAAKVIDGVAPKQVALDYVIDLKRSTKVQTFFSTRDDNDFNVFLARVERTVEIIQKGAYMPTQPTNWKCSERWCGYWKTCPFAKRPKTVNVPNLPTTEEGVSINAAE